MAEAVSIVGDILTIERDAPELSFLAPPDVSLPQAKTIWFKALDGHWLNFIRLPRAATATVDRGAVMLVHGTAVRANLFCSPMTVTLPAMLSAEGFDVWMLNWRASIDLRPIPWNLDDAAVLDYPAAVAVIKQVAKVPKIKAVIHCQGSTSFLMSMVAGCVSQDDVETVVANSSGLHPLLPWQARLKLPIALLVLGRMSAFDSQFGLYASSFGGKVMQWLIRATHHECNYAICKASSFIYGMGAPTMWNHDNLDDTTHQWLDGEFGYAPVRLFRQIALCVRRKRAVSMNDGRYPQSVLPEDFTTKNPNITATTFHFITGAENRCFLPKAVKKTADFFNEYDRGKPHTYREFPGYGHMDVFFGKNAHEDVHPYIVRKLIG